MRKKLELQNPAFEVGKYLSEQVCPLCHQPVKQSDYLKSEIQDPKTLWFANLVTHYRHNHISAWNKSWGDEGRNYRRKWHVDYGYEKEEVNERAKRQLIRFGHIILKGNGVNLETIKGLDYNTKETLEIAKKFL